MAEQFLSQINSIMRLCDDTDGILVTDCAGIVEYLHVPSKIRGRFRLPETVGRHILELYPQLTEETSTILQVLRTGEPSYLVRQETYNLFGERVVLDSTTLPILVDGAVRGAVDSTRFYSIDHTELRKEQAGSRLACLDQIITQDPGMLALIDRVRSVANMEASVLICGETGTGKELFAEALHTESKRANKPFISQNCAAIPGNLLESIFFGTEKGSYTGAVSRRGLLELADGGTLFLDEINSMDIGLQAKLLKALEEKMVRRVGGERDIPFQVRVVTAMNEDPRKVLVEKRVREDLFYRVGVLRLNIPPLRERPGDITLLAQHFIRRFSVQSGRKVCGLSDLAESLFQQYPWPGNVRELRNTIEGAFATNVGELLMVEDVQDILWHRRCCYAVPPVPEQVLLPEGGCSLEEMTRQYEHQLIAAAMARHGTISAAARALGISRQRLQYKLQKSLLQKSLHTQDILQF